MACSRRLKRLLEIAFLMKAVLVQKRAARLEVGGEEGCAYKRYGHGMVITSAVDRRTCGSSRWRLLPSRTPRIGSRW